MGEHPRDVGKRIRKDMKNRLDMLFVDATIDLRQLLLDMVDEMERVEDLLYDRTDPRLFG